ncbi:SDR family oxidoreductase [Bradyrhizobium sp. CCGUVB14]|uniref:SDR family NAD(P)-dependent oxidoreductase n=1 Tax=Bradyrhizobium sp. CCGUVB14 TaxID=2949628 RepID=UPI0020B35B29|nr:SDR family NAD(P)-dependent oxidoreductase [Bradyrhizobium sp. CCGUVB14]MCP3446065.1 SDR family NAD(P)-dependent oxidoreductase [Bradyrhizobium sp. CCGUVB14]
MQLEGGSVLITGAGSGIGEALAIEGARRRMHVALMGRRAEALEATLAKLAGGPHLALPGDVTEARDRLSALDAISGRWGTLMVLVNNAGLVPAGPLAAATDEELKATINTNLFAPMAMARDAVPLLERYRPGRIVNIGSVLGEIPYPLFAAYSATKGGLRAFSQSLRRELAPTGIGVTHAVLRATQTPAADALGPIRARFNMSFDSPGAVATRVWDAVERDADCVYPAGPERFFELVQRMAPRLVDRSIIRQLTRA